MGRGGLRAGRVQQHLRKSLNLAAMCNVHGVQIARTWAVPIGPNNYRRRPVISSDLVLGKGPCGRRTRVWSCDNFPPIWCGGRRYGIAGDLRGAGTKGTIMKHCQKCNLDFPDSFRFCGSCGGALPSSLSCQGCGELVEAKWTFCTNCGESLSERQSDGVTQSKAPEPPELAAAPVPHSSTPRTPGISNINYASL